MRQILLFFILIMLSSVNQCQPEMPPYIHYYDYLQGGLVIERADGTNSQLIPNLIPDGHNTALTPEWSVSGKWFVSSTYDKNRMPSDKNLSTTIVSTDGTKRIDLGIYSLSGFKVSWSPINDTLLVFAGEPTLAPVHFYLLDVETETVLVDFTLDTHQPDHLGYIQVHWSADGQQAFAVWLSNIVMLNRDGTVEFDSYPIRYPIIRFWTFEQGKLFYVTDESGVLTAVIEDFTDKRRVTFEADENNLYQIRWNLATTHAVISVHQCIANECVPSLKLLNWETSAISDITPTINTTLYACDEWEEEYCNELWSPDGAWIFLQNTSAGIVHLLDTRTGQTRSLSETGDVFNVGWLADNILYLFYNDDTALRLYDPLTETETKLQIPISGRYRVFGSPSGAYIGLVSDPPQMITPSGEVIRQLENHHEQPTTLKEPKNYRWDEGETWGIADFMVYYTGSSIGPTVSTIFEIKGVFQRELPVDGQSGFLPSRAVSYLPP